MPKNKKKYHDSKKGVGSVLPMSDKVTSVSNIHSGNTGSYGDTMEYADKQIKKNTNWKLNKDD